MDPENLWTGPHRVVFDISKRLSEAGNRVTVCTSDMLDMATKVSGSQRSFSHGFEIIRARNLSHQLYRSSGLLITPDLGRFLSERIQDYDVVHVHEYTTYQNIAVRNLAKKHRIPYVLQAHGSLPMSSKRVRKWLYYLFFGAKVLKDASRVIAVSEVEAEQYRILGVPNEKIEVIPNGIDLSEYADLPLKGFFRKKYGIDDRMVLYLGRINKIKGIDILVRAFAKVVGKLGDVKLVVAGPDHGYLGELKALIKTLKIEDDVLISGPLYGRDKLAAYVDADVYVLPSRYEIFGITVLESVACGTPVILTERCGIAGNFRNRVGLVVEPDSRNLQQALLEMLTDREKQQVFRENCKTVVQRFDISETVSKLEKVYCSLL